MEYDYELEMGSQMQRSCPPNSLRFISGALLNIQSRRQGHQRGISELEKRQKAHFKDLIPQIRSNGSQKYTHIYILSAFPGPWVIKEKH